MVGETSAGKLVVEIVGDVSGLITAYDTAKKETDGLTAKFTQIGERMTSIGKDMTLKVTAPLALMGGLALKTAATFDDSMRQVAAVTGATGDQFDRLRQQAIDLGASTAWSASEVATAMQYLGQAGLDTNEILAATPQMLSLASAGALDLGTAANISTNVLAGFNLEISDLAHVSDVLAQAASSSNTSVEGLGTAMSYVGPVASAAGLSIEETSAAIGLMSNAGIEGSMAGTALRGALTSLMSPTAQVTATLAQYGLTAADVDPQVHSLAEIIDTLGAANLSTADTMTIFGDRAGPGMIALLSAGSGALDDYAATLEDCDGAAQQMAETMEGGVGGSLRELEGAVETLNITFGDLIAEAIMPAIDAATRLTNWISNLDEGTQRAIVTAGLFAAAVGPATWALGSMAGGVGQIIALYKVYQASTIAATIATKGFAAAILANPVTLAIAGIATLAAVLLTLKMNTNEATEAAKAHAAALIDTDEMVAKSTEELTTYIDGQRLAADALREEIQELENAKRGLDKETVSRRSNARAMGDSYLAAQDLTAALNKNSAALRDVENFTLDVTLATKKHELSMTDASIAAADYVRGLKGVASAAQTELRRADQAYRDHQKTVSNLQKEYDTLSKTIDKALGIDREMQDTERDIERAEIRQIRAKQNLADLDEEIKAKELELRTGNYQSIEERKAAEQELADLKLRHREAVLDVADAETSYTDALEESARVKEEKTQLEKDLNGESIESAQGRLGELKRLIDEETETMALAQAEREEAERIHQAALTEIEKAGTSEQMNDWATAKKFIEENPIFAKTYHISYDESGSPSYTPQVPTVTILPPSLLPVEFSSVGRQERPEPAPAAAAPAPARAATSPQVSINQNIYTQTQSATEVAAATKRGLRDAALEGSL